MDARVAGKPDTSVRVADAWPAHGHTQRSLGCLRAARFVLLPQAVLLQKNLGVVSFAAPTSGVGNRHDSWFPPETTCWNTRGWLL